MKDKFFIITNWLVNAMFIVGIPATLAMPWFVRWYAQYNEYYAKYYIYQIILLMISGVFACLIMYELRKMMHSVAIEDCFVYENVISLRRMGSYAFVISIASFLRFTFDTTPGVTVVVCVFVIAGLFSKVLANVFARAVAYKEENDMTI